MKFNHGKSLEEIVDEEKVDNIMESFMEAWQEEIQRSERIPETFERLPETFEDQIEHMEQREVRDAYEDFEPLSEEEWAEIMKESIYYPKPDIEK